MRRLAWRLKNILHVQRRSIELILRTELARNGTVTGDQLVGRRLVAVNPNN